MTHVPSLSAMRESWRFQTFSDLKITRSCLAYHEYVLSISVATMFDLLQMSSQGQSFGQLTEPMV